MTSRLRVRKISKAIGVGILSLLITGCSDAVLEFERLFYGPTDPPPLEVLSLEAEPLSLTEVKLTWTSSNPAEVLYRLRYQEGGLPPEGCTVGLAVSPDDMSGASVLVSGLIPKTEYSFRLCAVNWNSPPDVSKGITLTIVTPGATDPPPDVVNLRADAVSASEIQLQWLSGGGSTTGYRISYQEGRSSPPDCASGSQVSEAEISAGLSHLINGLVAATEYSFRVCAINGNDPVDVSPGTTVTTMTLQEPPPNPSVAEAIPESSSQIRLSWSPSAGSTVDYRISYQMGTIAPADCQSGTLISENLIAGTMHTVTGLLSATAYAFRICSINGNPMPDVSSGIITSASTFQMAPPDPINLTAVPISTTAIGLSWSSGGGTTLGYRVAYLVGPTPPPDCYSGIQIDQGSILGTTHTLSGLSPETTYAFRLCAVGALEPPLALPHTSAGVTLIKVTPGPLVWASADEILITRNSGYSYPFAVTGGLPPYTYSISSAAAGGAINASTGRYIAGLQAGVDHIEVTDSLGQKVFGEARNKTVLTNGIVKAQALDGSGGWYLGGDFTQVTPQSAKHLAKISTSDGQMDLGFTLDGFDAPVRAAVALPDGSWIVGGDFNSYRGTLRKRLAKLQKNGDLDPSFDPGAGFNFSVHAIVSDGVGAVFVGGSFTTYQGVAAERIIKLNTNTAERETSFAASPAFDQSVTSLVYAGGGLYVGGIFAAHGGTPRQRIAKLDPLTGQLDTVFNSASGADGSVNALAWNNGSLYVGGSFLNFSGLPRPYLVKVDGITAGIDTSFGAVGSFNYFVSALAVAPDGLFVGGGFTTFAGNNAGRLAKLSLNSGSLDMTFAVEQGANSDVSSLYYDGVSSLYVGGSFTKYKGQARQHLVKLSAVTAVSDNTFLTQNGFSAPVNAMAGGNGDLVVAGDFEFYHGQPRSYLAKFSSVTGQVDPLFNVGSGLDAGVTALGYYNDSLFVAGYFTSYQGATARSVVKIDSATATRDAGFNSGSGIIGEVTSLAFDADAVFIGGSFTSYNGQSHGRLVKISAASGLVDPGFNIGSGFDNKVWTLATNAGSLYAGGDFVNVSSLTRQRIAKLSTSTGIVDPSFNSVSGFSGSVRSLAIAGTSVFAVGAFSAYKGLSRSRIAKVDMITADLDSSFGQSLSGPSTTPAAVVVAGGGVFVAGSFTTFHGQPRESLAKLDPFTGQLDPSYDTSLGFAGGVIYSMVADGSDLFLGGAFTKYRSAPAAYALKLGLFSVDPSPSH